MFGKKKQVECNSCSGTGYKVHVVFKCGSCGHASQAATPAESDGEPLSNSFSCTRCRNEIAYPGETLSSYQPGFANPANSADRCYTCQGTGSVKQ